MLLCFSSCSQCKLVNIVRFCSVQVRSDSFKLNTSFITVSWRPRVVFSPLTITTRKGVRECSVSFWPPCMHVFEDVVILCSYIVQVLKKKKSFFSANLKVVGTAQRAFVYIGNVFLFFSWLERNSWWSVFFVASVVTSCLRVILKATSGHPSFICNVGKAASFAAESQQKGISTLN